MIALGSDQAGYELKQVIIRHLEERGLEYKDYGSYNADPVDYPVYGKKVAHAIVEGECDKGILICGTGIGISIAANKIKGIRAAVCSDCFSAEATRLHNDANILAFGARVIGPGLAEKIVEVAAESGVPVYEDNSLATMLSQLSLGPEIPDSLYRAIVEIYVYFLHFDPETGVSSGPTAQQQAEQPAEAPPPEEEDQ